MNYQLIYLGGIAVGFTLVFLGLVVVTGIRLAAYAHSNVHYAHEADETQIIGQFVLLTIVLVVGSLLWPIITALAILIGVPYLIARFVLWIRDRTGEHDAG